MPYWRAANLSDLAAMGLPVGNHRWFRDPRRSSQLGRAAAPGLSEAYSTETSVVEGCLPLTSNYIGDYSFGQAYPVRTIRRWAAPVRGPLLSRGSRCLERG